MVVELWPSFPRAFPGTVRNARELARETRTLGEVHQPDCWVPPQVPMPVIEQVTTDRS